MRTKTTAKHFGVLSLLLLPLCFMTACSSGSDDEPDSGNNALTENDFGEVGSNSSFVSDVNMSDVDLLIDFAINCDLLDLEWIRFCSNDFKGDLLSGPGECSDESFYLEVERDIMANADKYIDAMNRLADDGIFDNTTTRGLKDAVQTTGGWVLNIVTGAKDTQDKMRAILRDMGAFSDKQMQEDIFSCLKEGSRGGYKDAHSFFVALNNSETSYEMLLSANQQFVQIDHGIQEIERPGYQTHTKWENSRDKLNVKDWRNRMVDAGKDLTNNAIKIEETVVDAMTGGGYSTAQKIDKKIKDTEETLKKMFGDNPDKLTKEQVEKGLNKRGIDKLKSWIPKTGNDNVDAIVKFAADKLGDMALKKDPTGEVAKENGKTILDIKNNTDEKQKVIVVTGDDGKASVVIPDKDGNGTSVTGPGNKKITAVTKDGKRSTKATTAKKDSGKQEEKLSPDPTGTPRISVSDSKISFQATPKDKEKTKMITVTTNCKYFATKGKADWLTITKNTKAGTVTLTVTQPNTTKEKREFKLQIVGSNDKKTYDATAEITVTQEAFVEGKLSANTTYFEMEAEGGSDQTTINAEGYEKVEIEVSDKCKEWLTASLTTNSLGNDVLKFTAKPNSTSSYRTGTIFVRAGNASKLTKDNSQTIEIIVTQAAEDLKYSIENSIVEFESKKDTKTLTIETNADNVEVTPNRDWLKATYSGGKLTISVEENEETETRSGAISVAMSRMIQTSETSGYTKKITVDIDVYQEGVEGYQIINGTWSYDNTILVFKGKKYSYKSGSYSESGDFIIDDFKATKIAGTDGFNVTGTLRGIKNDSWTIKTYYSKDGSGHYKKRQYCLWLTNSSGQTINVYKE